MKSRFTSGFTLIEVLVSVGIIALVGTVIAQVFFATVRTSTKTELLKDIKQNGDFALDVMSRMIRNANRVTTSCTTSGTTTGTITILNPDSNASTFGCTLDNLIPRIASTSSGKTQYLTSRNVSLGTDCTNALTFICTALPNQKTSVQILFTLGQVGTPVDQFEKGSSRFQTTVVTRQ